MIEITTVAGNVWTGTLVPEMTDDRFVSIETAGGAGYRIPRFRITSMREV